FDWVFAFEHETRITVECLWRLLEKGRVRLTSEDNGQKFGLPAPIDAAAEVNHRIKGELVKRAELRAGVLDLELPLERGCILQIIPNSSGYEAWNVGCPIGLFIAVGGGDLSIYRNPSAGP